MFSQNDLSESYLFIYMRIPFTRCCPGEPQAFSVSVTPMADYPLDLYILMDLSTSMNDDLTSIKELSVGLGKTSGACMLY